MKERERIERKRNKIERMKENGLIMVEYIEPLHSIVCY